MQHCHPLVPKRWALGLACHRRWHERAGRTISTCLPWPPSFRWWYFSCWFRLDPRGSNKNLRNPSEPETAQLSVCSSAFKPEDLKNPAMVPSSRWPTTGGIGSASYPPVIADVRLRLPRRS